jgi:hypothetical protein
MRPPARRPEHGPDQTVDDGATVDCDRSPNRDRAAMLGPESSICREILSGSDGTRTRDLRRDRPAL